MSYQDDNYRDSASTSPPDRGPHDDRDQYERDEYERERSGFSGQTVPPAQKGCSKGCLYGMAGCGCVTVLAAVVIGVLGWKLFDTVLKGMSNDPAVIRAATLEMADIAPPAGFEPKIKMDLIAAKVIIYQTLDTKSSLVLTQINPRFAPKNGQINQKFGEDFQKGFDEGQGRKKQELKIEKSEVQDVKIRGQMTKVTFSEAKNAEGAKFEIVNTEFPGKAGTVVLVLEQPLEKYDEAEVKKFLESIK